MLTSADTGLALLTAPPTEVGGRIQAQSFVLSAHFDQEVDPCIDPASLPLMHTFIDPLFFLLRAEQVYKSGNSFVSLF